jgi:hypothetical protein
MAWRLGEQVICGELFNTRRYSVHGWLQLRDQEQPLMLELTGNCDPDLAGWHIRFEARENPQAGEGAPAGESSPGAPSDGKKPFMAWQQIGPTGTMTAARKVKVTDCPPLELYRRCELGEPPPFEWKPCLYLEWFSQNGQVVVELVDPVIEYVERKDLKGSSAEALRKADTAPEADSESEGDPESEGNSTSGGLQITSIRVDDTGEVEIRDETPAAARQGEEGDEEHQDDPYRLMPDELQQQFDSQASETDRLLQGDEDDAQFIHELELMDDLMEQSPGEALGSIFDGPLRLPRPEQVISDEQAEGALKTLLAQLALYGIALDVCEHCGPREAYRFLLEKICPEGRAYPQLRNTQWVQHFATSDYCAECEADAERDYQEYERKRKEESGEDPPETGGPCDGPDPSDPAGDDVP